MNNQTNVKEAKIPEYIRVYELARQKIVSGDYKYGEKLPSKRVAAEKADVSVITIQHAYELLCDEGYIETRQRSGYYVIYRKDDFIDADIEKGTFADDYVHDAKMVSSEARTHKDKAKNTEKVEISFNVLSKTMRKVLLDYGDRLLIKPPNLGCVELRGAIKSYLAVTRSIHVDVDQIIIGSGAEYLYGLIAQLFDDGSVIAVEDPSYDKITKVYKAFGHEVEALKLGSDGILKSELARTRATVLHVTPFHSYPSKITAGISKKYEYLKWAGEDKYIIEDNYDSELTVSRKLEDALFSIADKDNVIYINTFSKTIAPSIRVGYMILPKELMRRYNEKLGFYSCTVPTLEQYMLCEMIKSGEFQRHINKVRRSLRREAINDR